jgi:hypothetical protein
MSVDFAGLTPETRAQIAAAVGGRERTVFDLLADCQPVTINVLFAAINNTPGIYDQKMKQMRIGGRISNLNRVLNRHGLRAVPGEPRGTYRIRGCQ